MKILLNIFKFIIKNKRKIICFMINKIKTRVSKSKLKISAIMKKKKLKK